MTLEQIYRVHWYENCSLREQLFATQREALVFIGRHASSFDPLRGTLQQFVDWIWLPWLGSCVSSRTLKAYRWMLNVHILSALGGRPLAELSTLEIEARLAQLRESGIAADALRKVTFMMRSICQSATELRLAIIPLASGRKPRPRQAPLRWQPHNMELDELILVSWFEHCHLRQRRFTGSDEAQTFIDRTAASFDELVGTLVEFCNLVWLPDQLGRVAPTTLQKYGTLLNGSLLPALGNRLLRELTMDDFASYLEAEQRRGLSDPSMKLRRAVVRSIASSARVDRSRKREEP